MPDPLDPAARAPLTLSIVVVMGADRVIGADGAVPWRLAADLAGFRQATLGHPMIMGRATYDSIGRPLPGRTSIVLTRDLRWRASGVLVAHDLDEAVALARDLDDEATVIGGAEVFAEVLGRDLVDLMVMTRVGDSPPGDTYFPVVDWSRWREVGRVPHVGESDGRRLAFDVVTYERGVAADLA